MSYCDGCADWEKINVKHGEAWADLDRFLGEHRHAGDMTLQDAIKARISLLEAANATLHQECVAKTERIAEFEAELRRRGPTEYRIWSYWTGDTE